jgi:hypothetical protein
MKTLFLAWQHPQTRSWYPVGKLIHDGRLYTFVYTKGAKVCPDFYPFGRMTDLKAVYRSEALFPLFANRLLPKSRPEYQDYLKWLNVDEEHDSPIATLSRSGGMRGTDSLEVFPEPEPTRDGHYEFVFLSHGLRHLPQLALDRVNQFQQGEQLSLCADLQNEKDPDALSIRTKPPIAFVGFCPRYLVSDFRALLEANGPSNVRLSVERVNPDAPLQLRLLCRLSTKWPTNFRPFSDDSFTPIPDRARLDRMERSDEGRVVTTAR